MKLSERLAAIVSFVEIEDKVADIGTDHAIIPIYLASKGEVPVLIASDLNEGPVQAAAANVREAGFSDRIDIRLGNGLDSLEPGEVDVIIIAGMGGGTIKEILAKRPAVVRELRKLILQPMNDERVLRKWLSQNGWHIADELLVAEDNRLYTVIKAERKEVSAGDLLSKEEILFGPVLLAKKDPLLKVKLEKEILHLKKVLEQMNYSTSEAALERRLGIEQEILSIERVLQWLSNVKLS